MKTFRNLSRRRFLARGVAGTTALGLARFLGPPARAAAPKATITPYADNLEAYRKVDPKLIHYEQSGRIPSLRAEPKRIAFAADGRLVIAAGKYITAVDRAGTRVMEFSLSEEVRCFEVAKDGTVYVGLRDHIEVFDRQGQRLATWKSPANRAWLTSLAATENDVFASDAGNRIVCRFDRSGKLVGRIGAKDKQRNIPGFLVPSPYFDLEVGADGLLWVVNPGLHELEAYTFDGELKSKWGVPSFGITGFCGCCNPAYFARLPDGRFVTSEKGLVRIKVYSTQGALESVVAGPDAFPKYAENLNANPIPVDIAVDAAGLVYVADTLGNEIRVFRRKEKV